MNIFVLNAGSSTHKAALFALPNSIPIWKCLIDWKQSGGRPKCTVNGKEWLFDKQPSIEEVFQQLIASLPTKDIQAVGHRVVHGGAKYSQPVVVDSLVEKEIELLCSLAPLHNPKNLEGIRLMRKMLPDIPQVAVFDTAFHRTIPAVAKTYPIPEDWRKQGIERYGFHGINHQWCAKQAEEMLGKKLRVISCHLGGGCSLAASVNGVCKDTTMGFTPLEGIVMGSRAGSIDPGIILSLLNNHSVEDIEKALNNACGLTGLCGTQDMRAILNNIARGDDSAKLAFDIFCYKAAQGIASMAAGINGVDAIAFTAGIGENSADVRKAICDRLAFLGVKLDEEANKASSKVNRTVSAASSKVSVLVIPSQEELAIALSIHLVRGRA